MRERLLTREARPLHDERVAAEAKAPLVELRHPLCARQALRDDRVRLVLVREDDDDVLGRARRAAGDRQVEHLVLGEVRDDRRAVGRRGEDPERLGVAREHLEVRHAIEHQAHDLLVAVPEALGVSARRVEREVLARVLRREAGLELHGRLAGCAVISARLGLRREIVERRVARRLGEGLVVRLHQRALRPAEPAPAEFHPTEAADDVRVTGDDEPRRLDAGDDGVR